MSRAHRRLVWALGGSLTAAMLVAALALGWLLVAALDTPYRGWSGEAVTVWLEPGLDAGTMLERLHEAGVVRDPHVLRAWLGFRGRAAELKAGEYRFERAASGREVAERLIGGDVLLHAVTLPEGLTLAETAARFERAGFGPLSAFSAAFTDPAPIAGLDPAAADLEGYLFPDTYRFPRGTPPATIAGTLVARFVAVAGADYAERAASVGLDLREAVTLASLIERETGVEDERARVSRVFHNRLGRGMRLECDPTVLYALERAGRVVTRLSTNHLRFESPWNTYLHAGLPPGPIANPGRESLIAAVDPGPGEELFFVAAPGGGHRFSRDLSSHNRAVAELRRHLRSSR